jgi:hypothetical protein
MFLDHPRIPVMSENTDELVLLQAPLGAVPAMLEARERWRRGERGGDEAREREDGVVVADNWWRAKDVARLRDAVPYDSVRTLLSMCAQRPGEWIDKAAADAAAGVTPRQLASELGALSKFTLREFGPGRDGKPKWPIEYRKVANRFSYRMSPEMAAIWNS